MFSVRCARESTSSRYIELMISRFRCTVNVLWNIFPQGFMRLLMLQFSIWKKKPSVNNYMHLLYVIQWFTVGEKPFLQLWYSMYRLTCICKALHIKSILHNQVSIFVCFIFCVLIACILVRMYKINSISCLTMYLFRTSEFTKSSQSLCSQAFVCFPIHTV